MSGSPERWCVKCKCRCHCYAQSVLIVQMMYVTNVIVVRKEMIFKHENFVLDTQNAGRSGIV